MSEVKYEYVWARCEYEECVPITENETGQLTIPQELEGWPTVVTVIATDEQGKIGVAGSEETAPIAETIPHYAVREEVSGGGSLTGAADLQTSALADMNLGCPGACGANFPYVASTSIELVAHPDPGATFLGWGGACSGTALTCSFTVSADETVTASFTPAPLPRQLLPPPESTEADAPGEGGAAAGAPVSGESEDGQELPSAPSRARLLGFHTLHHHIQAVAACEQARTCHLRLALLASSSARTVMVAERSFTIAPGRRARLGLALDAQGKRLLTRRRRLPVTARLALSVGGRWVEASQGHLTLIA